METAQKSLYLLLSGLIILFSACGGLESEREIEESLTSAGIRVFTFEPEIADQQVTLKASTSFDRNKVDQELVWGFMWFEDNGTAEREFRKLTVGRGFSSGPFQILKDDFPAGKNIGYCAFVDFKASPDAEVEQIIGEEIWFETN